MDTMSLDKNIENAFNVVLKTYENLDKMMKHCDLIAENRNYEAKTEKFLRYKSDVNYYGWFIRAFFKLYQNKDDQGLNSDWRSGPVFCMEINFEGTPKIFLSKFEYEDMNSWDSGISPSLFWGYWNPIKSRNDGFMINPLENNYFESKPEREYMKEKYWGLQRVVYTEINLIDVTANNIEEKIFGEFDKLREK